MALPQEKIYTEEDYYNLPEDVRAELIEGQFYNMSAPNRVHQELLGAMYLTIANQAFVNTGLLMRKTMKFMYTIWQMKRLPRKLIPFMTP